MTESVGFTPNEMVVYPTDIPGLVDAVTPDGRTLTDLTMGQVKSLVLQNGWAVAYRV